MYLSSPIWSVDWIALVWSGVISDYTRALDSDGITGCVCVCVWVVRWEWAFLPEKACLLRIIPQSINPHDSFVSRVCWEQRKNRNQLSQMRKWEILYTSSGVTTQVKVSFFYIKILSSVSAKYPETIVSKIFIGRFSQYKHCWLCGALRSSWPELTHRPVAGVWRREYLFVLPSAGRLKIVLMYFMW